MNELIIEYFIKQADMSPARHRSPEREPISFLFPHFRLRMKFIKPDKRLEYVVHIESRAAFHKRKAPLSRQRQSLLEADLAMILCKTQHENILVAKRKRANQGPICFPPLSPGKCGQTRGTPARTCERWLRKTSDW